MIARLCKKEDKATWVALNKEFIEYETGDNEFWSEAAAVSTQKLEETFDAAMEKEGDILLVLFVHNDKVLGFANIVRFFSVWANGDSLMVDDFFIREEYRHLGIGRDAIHMIEDYANKNKFRRIQFHAEANNPEASGFYEAIGFKPADMKFYMRYIK
ncbi:MAG: GNAT family N-acetyltransferase [Anaerovoracaceae bacterium]